MKKYLSWLPVALLIFGSAFYKIEESATHPQVSKNITFTMFKGADYTSGVYDCAEVKVNIIIEKVSSKSRTEVWNKSFDAKLLREYPALENASLEKVTVPNIHIRKEHLEVTYTLTYISNGAELQMQYSAEISQKPDSELEISI